MMELDDARIPLGQRKIFLEIVSQMLITDCKVTIEEDAFFAQLVERLRLTPEDAADVMSNVNLGERIETKVRKLSRQVRAHLEQVLSAAAAIDNELEPREVELLERVAATMRILKAHPTLSVPPLELED